MKLLVIFTGGTIACSRGGEGLSPDSGNSFLLLELYKQTHPDASFDTACPYFILSENLGRAQLEALYDCVKDNLGRYDGIVVTHGTDTLPYTAAYLSLRLGMCDTPVVLVSAAYPLDDSRSNGLSNFTGAVDFIRSRQGRGVFVSYQNNGETLRIHRGYKVLPHAPYSDRIESLFGQWYAEVKAGTVRRNPGFTEDNLPQGNPFERRVLWLRVHPGMVLPSLSHTDVVLFEGYHSGTLPTANSAFAAFCNAAHEQGVSLYLTGAQEGFDYESKQAFDRLHIRELPPMSPVTAFFAVGCQR